MKDILKHLEVKPLASFSPGEQADLAFKVAHFTQAQAKAGSKIVPVTAEVVLHKPISLVATINGDFAGFVSANTALEHDGELLTKIGTLVVPKPFQGHGMAKHLVNQVTGHVVVQEMVPYTFAGVHSLSGFVQTGYTLAEPSELPPGEFSPYGNTPLVHG